MSLSENNATSLMYTLHQDIEDYATTIVKNIVENKDFDFLVYPPNNGFTDEETIELNKLANNEHLKSAFKKLLVDNSAGVVFSFLNIIDGTADPILAAENWEGIQFVDLEENDNDPIEEMLHDKFFETYWDWLRLKEDSNS